MGGVVASFFRVSMVLREVHSLMTEQYELPSWSVYVMFATVTILIGALLGLLLVFCIDCVLPYLMGSGIKQSEAAPSPDVPVESAEDNGSDFNDDVSEESSKGTGEEQ